MPVRRLWVVIAIMLSSGCAGWQHYQFDARNQGQAFAELVNRRQQIGTVHSSARIKFALPDGDFTANSTIDYSRDTGWSVELTGPFGIKLALLESSGQWYYLTLPQVGQVRQGKLTDGIEIPEIGIVLPPIESLDRLFMPTPDITPASDWLMVAGTVGDSGSLSAKRLGILNRDSLAVRLSYAPLNVYQEQWFYAGKKKLTRCFYRKNHSQLLPSSMDVTLGEIKIELTFNTLHTTPWEPTADTTG